MAAAPSPASLEKAPRAQPQRMAAATVVPAKPPVAAAGEKALLKIRAKSPGTWLRWVNTTTSPAPM